MAVLNTLTVLILVLVSTPLSQQLPLTTKTQDVTIRKEPDVSILKLYNRFTAPKFIVEGDISHLSTNCTYGWHPCSRVSHTSRNSTYMEIVFAFDKLENAVDNAVAKLELRYDRIPGDEVVAMVNFTTVIPAEDILECHLNTNMTISCPTPITQRGNWSGWVTREDNITIVRDEQETTLTMPCKHQYNGTTVTYIVAGMTICKTRLKVLGEDTPSDTTPPCSTVETTMPETASGLTTQLADQDTATLQVTYTVLLVPLSIVQMAILVVLLVLLKRKAYCSACHKKINSKVRKKLPAVYPNDNSSDQRLVVKGIEEQPQGTAGRTRKKKDSAAVKTLLSSLGIEGGSIGDTKRLGVYSPPRPVLASFSNREDVDKILHHRGASRHFSPFRSPEDLAMLTVLQEHKKLLDKSGVEPNRIKLDHNFLLIDNQYHGYVDSDNTYQTLPPDHD